MVIRKDVVFDGKGYHVVVEEKTYVTENSSLEVSIQRNGDRVYLTNVQVPYDKNMYMNAIKLAFNEYANTEEYDAYDNFSDWDGIIKEEKENQSLKITIKPELDTEAIKHIEKEIDKVAKRMTEKLLGRLEGHFGKI